MVIPETMTYNQSYVKKSIFVAMKAEPALSLTERAYATLRGNILSCRLRPGAKLKIGDIADEMGVSLAVVREALTRLSAEGLVNTETQRGFHVPPVSARDLTHLTAARIEIECLCLAQSIADGGLDWESALVAAHHRLARQPERAEDDPGRVDDAWAEAHALFHRALIAGCDNAWLLRMRELLFAQSERYRRLSVVLQTNKRDIPAEHAGLLAATIDRDTVLATERMRSHLSLTSQVLLESGICDE